MNTLLRLPRMSSSRAIAAAFATQMQALRRAPFYLLIGALLALGAGLPRAQALQTIIANRTDHSLYVVDLATGDRTVLSSATIGTGPVPNLPVSVARATNGDVYVGTDSSIIKVDVATGNRTALLNPDAVTYQQIYGLAFDASGRLIASSCNGQAIYRIDPATGIRTTLASTTVGSGADVGRPGGVLIDADGTIVYADFYSWRLLRLDPTTLVRTVISSAVAPVVGTGSSAGKSGTVVKLADGSFAVSNYDSDATTDWIMRVDPTTGNRTVLTSATVGTGDTMRGVYALSIGTDGSFYASSSRTNTIFKIDPATGNRTVVSVSGSVGSGPAFSFPLGILSTAVASVTTPDAPAPVITSATTGSATYNQSFSYTITASNTPTSYAATGLPAGLSLDSATGAITGTPTAAGTYTVTLSATNAGGTGTATLTLDVAKAAQTISFAALDNKLVTDVPFTLAATSSSGLPITYTIVSGPATLTDATVTLTGVSGTVVIRASQAGNANYSAATDVTQQFTVSASVPQIDLGTSGNTLTTNYGQQFSYTITASNTPTSYAATGLPAGLSIDPETGAITGTPTAAGTYTVTLSATNAGGTGTTTLTLYVAPVAQVISFSALADKLTTDGAFTLGATSSSGLPVTYTIVSGPAMLDGHTVTLTGASGWVVVRAAQAGNGNYTGASEVTQRFYVAAVGPQIFYGRTVATNAASTGLTAYSAAAINLAANIAKDNSTGTIIGYVAASNQGFVCDFVPAADGSFSGTAQVYSGGTTASATPHILSVTTREGALTATAWTIRGTVINGVITGTIADKSLTFSADMQSQSGPTATVAGYYVAPSTNTASGSTYAVVNAVGETYVLAITSTSVSAATGTATADGALSATLGTGTLTGTINPDTTVVTASLQTAGGGTVTFGGIKSSTLRTDRLVNLSSRAQSGPGEKVLITGFVIGGTTAKRVLLRGVGPTLAGHGVKAPLTNPTLKLFDASGALLYQNDDWSDAATAEVAATIGAFALPTGSKDAAILATLPPGSYTMHVADASGAVGVALAEIYDASENPQADYQRLINISSRGQVGTNENVLFGGFVVTGNSPKRILIRGVGPALGAFGVANCLSDPLVQVYQAGIVIAKNDNWGTPVTVLNGQTAADATTIAEASAVTGAASFAADSKDAALIVTLAPGAYTVSVAGVGGTSGVAMVEVYEIP